MKWRGISLHIPFIIAAVAGLTKKLFGNETLSSLAHSSMEGKAGSGKVEGSGVVVPFAFDTPSPDDLVLAQQGKAFQRGGGKGPY